MSFLNNTPKGAEIISNMPCMAKKVRLPADIDCSPCSIDVSDPYFIYRSMANRIVAGISEKLNMKYDYVHEKFADYANTVVEKPPLMGLIYLFTHKTDLYEQCENEKMDMELYYSIGQLFYSVAEDNGLKDKLSEPEFYRIISKYTQDRGCYDVITAIRIYDAVNNLQEHHLDSMRLRGCELTILSCLEPEAQLFYYDLFMEHRDNEEIAWNRIRTHVYEREFGKNELITDNLVFRIQQETGNLYTDDTIRRGLRFIQTNYIKDTFNVSHINAICMGIKELLYSPVIDYIGTGDDGITRIFSFRVNNTKEFSIGLQSMIEMKKKTIITLYSEIGKKKKRRICC